MEHLATDRATRRSLAAVTGELQVEVREKCFPAPGGGSRLILGDVEFRMRPSELLVVLGPSGCGKTTLLNIVAGIDADFTGSVRLGAEPPAAARIGYVFQAPRLLPWRTVFDNVALAIPKGGDLSVVPWLLEEVGLAEFSSAYPLHLSVGMARRASLARAFAVEPELLLLDEPFVSVDEATARRLRDQVLALWRTRPTSVLLVTHNLREAAELADRILLLSDAPGRLIAEITVPVPREQRSESEAIELICQEIAARQSGRGSGAARPSPTAISATPETR
jgi:NitT/TauT family transport system ATP-binding protein